MISFFNSPFVAYCDHSLELQLPNFPFFEPEIVDPIWISWKSLPRFSIIPFIILVKVRATNVSLTIFVKIRFVRNHKIRAPSKCRSINVFVPNCLVILLLEREFIVIGDWEDKRLMRTVRFGSAIARIIPHQGSESSYFFFKLGQT